jgi:hypothetical protein
MGRSQSIADTIRVQRELEDIQLSIERIRGRLRFLEDQTSYATISVSIRERGVVAPAAGDEGWGVVEAWRDGAQAFVRVAGRAFVVLAGAAPLVLLLALGFLSVRAARRRSLFRWGASGP